MSSHADFGRGGPGRRKAPWTKQAYHNGSVDAELAAAALDAIEWLTTVAPETIQVSARNGWLHLKGTVTSRHQRTTLEEVTRHLSGVYGVINSVIVETGRSRAEAKDRPGEIAMRETALSAGVPPFASIRTVPFTGLDYLEG